MGNLILLLRLILADEPTPGLIEEKKPFIQIDYRKECGIYWTGFSLFGAEGFSFNNGPENRIVVSKQWWIKGPGTKTLPIRIGLQWGDEIININGLDNFKNIHVENYFSNLKKNNYIIFKRKNEVKMINFTCPPK